MKINVSLKLSALGSISDQEELQQVIRQISFRNEKMLLIFQISFPFSIAMVQGGSWNTWMEIFPTASTCNAISCDTRLMLSSSVIWSGQFFMFYSWLACNLLSISIWHKVYKKLYLARFFVINVWRPLNIHLCLRLLLEKSYKICFLLNFMSYAAGCLEFKRAGW